MTLPDVTVFVVRFSYINTHTAIDKHTDSRHIMTPDLTYLGWIESTVSMSAVGPYLMEKREKKTRIPARMNNIRVKKR